MEEVKRYQRTIGKLDVDASLDAVNKEKIIDSLNALKSFPMTYPILKETKIGFTISKLRKSPDTDIASQAKILVKQWKQFASSNSPRNTTPSSASSTTTVVRKGPGLPQPPSQQSPRKTLTKTPLPTNLSNTRLKVVEKFITIFEAQDIPDAQDLVSVSVALERAMAREYQLDTPAEAKKSYLNKVRQLSFNLKKNRPLVERLLLDGLEASVVLHMTSDELATEERRKEVEKLRDDAFQRTRLDWAEANADKINKQCGIKDSENGLFTCGRCKSSKTSNTQKQTRSADEPMTVFVLCHNCGARWKC